ncbi:MAG: cell division protein ZapA [Sutterella wadsworthensis]|uniref:cell division protein ZapA n=1 Tax=Sutterella wadsworthensis TaxID=40545 RepID=UPI00307EBC7B|nr:cell division protein ZapA [Sutterella wadsworthensis]
MSEVNVTIFDRNYRLAVTTGEEKMLEDCARQVNEQMLAVRAAGRVIAIDQIAVLTALELAYDAKKREHDAKKPASTPPQTPPQPVQQQAPAAAASTPNEADSALFAEIHSLCSLCEEALFRDAKMGSLF